jgi:hypothetical protein
MVSLQHGIPTDTVSLQTRYPYRHGTPTDTVFLQTLYPYRHGIPTDMVNLYIPIETLRLSVTVLAGWSPSFITVWLKVNRCRPNRGEFDGEIIQLNTFFGGLGEHPQIMVVLEGEGGSSSHSSQPFPHSTVE